MHHDRRGNRRRRRCYRTWPHRARQARLRRRGGSYGILIEARFFEATEEHLSGAEISALAAKGEQPARRIIKEAGFALGQAIAGLTNILDPDIVILSGSVVKAGAEWRAELQRGFDSQIPAIQRDLPIVGAELGTAAPLIGAAENLIDSL